MKILGLSCYYHDSAACLLDGGRIAAAAQEERFSRVKHDSRFPFRAARYCLAEAGIDASELDAVAFYEKPLLKFHRILETYLGVAPRGLRSFVRAIPAWTGEKLWLRAEISAALEVLGATEEIPLFFPEHHESHAASAFYPSPFDSAAVVTLDGVGEWATTTVGVGRGRELELLEEIRFPHSLGLLYSAFTYFTGFRVNSGEYKLMGLAPYGEPRYADLIREHLIDLKDDGSFRLDLSYFGYLDGLVMTNDRFADLFDGPARQPESRITRREMDLARSIQQVTEEVVLRIARHAREVTGERHLALAGGVALNCVANGELLRTGIFDDLWIQPAAGDAGGAVGAALAVWHQAFGAERKPLAPDEPDRMSGSYLGPAYDAEEIAAWLAHRGYPADRLDDDEAWADRVAAEIASDKVVGLFQGRMEYGPRALGNRSIVGDPRSPAMQSVMNLKIKYRESFRPFAPSCLVERVSDLFDLDRPSPYMLLVAPVAEHLQTEPEGGADTGDDLLAQIHQVRSQLPAITHVDGSARIQTVDSRTNPRYHRLIRAFERRSGFGVVINTSFNVRGEPIVATPEDAYRCFMRTEMDVLTLGPFLLWKTDQPEFVEAGDWRDEFQLD